MVEDENYPDKDAILKLIQTKLYKQQSCKQVADAYEQLALGTFNTIAIYLGSGAAASVTRYALARARFDTPLLDKIDILPSGLDFSELHIYANDPSCNEQEIMHAVMHLAEEIFHTLEELVGEALNQPLFTHLHQHEQQT